MHHILKGLGVTAALALIAIISLATPASAISADLAKKCRDMAIKAHPRKLPGSKTGSAQAERTFYQRCISDGGTGAGNNTQRGAAPPSK